MGCCRVEHRHLGLSRRPAGALGVSGMSRGIETTETYVVQQQWLAGLLKGEWMDYRRPLATIDEAREMLTLASAQSGFEGPWRIIHRVTVVVETVVEP